MNFWLGLITNTLNEADAVCELVLNMRVRLTCFRDDFTYFLTSISMRLIEKQIFNLEAVVLP